MLEELGQLIEQLQAQALTQDERQRLGEILGNNNVVQRIKQSGKYNVNLEELSGSQIGDRIIHQGLSIEEVTQLLLEILPLFNAIEPKAQPVDTASNPQSRPQNDRLERLTFDAHLVESVNSRLAAVERINQAIQIPDDQQNAFNNLKANVQSLNKINRELEELAKNSEQLLQEAIDSLDTKLREANSTDQESHLNAIVRSCLKQHVKILQQFRQELGQGKQVARWLDQHRSNIAERLGTHALGIYPQNGLTEKQVGDFYFTLEQFLERLSHCLQWGRFTTLDAPNTPKVLDNDLYLTAFHYLRDVIIPEHLPQEGVEQLNEYIDYLLKRLPTYRRIHMDV
jgi:hypothetical protein